MCELREKTKAELAEESGKLNVATIEAGNFELNNAPTEPLKETEYYEEALEKTTFGKFNYFIIVISGLILANVLLETLGMGFVMPVSQCDLNFTTQERGVLIAIGFVGIISSSHLWGFLADTKGRRYVIRPTLLMGFIFTVLSSFATNFWVMVTLRFLNGFCISGGSATIYAYLGEFHTNKNRSRAIMVSAFIFGIGCVLLPAIAWLVINQDWRLDILILDLTYKPWRFFMVVCGIPGFICGLCLFVIPESPKFLLSHGQEEKALDILRRIYHLNTGKPKDEFPITNVVEDLDTTMEPKKQLLDQSNPCFALLRSMWSQTQPLFNHEYRRNTILICTIQFWIFVTSNGMYMWFPDILNSVAEYRNENPNGRAHICDIVYAKHAERSQILNTTLNEGTITECSEKLDISTYEHSLVLELLYVIGFALIGSIINKISKNKILFIALVGCGVCGIASAFINQPLIATYLYVVLLLCGLGVNVMSAATVDLYPTRLRAMAVCISLMVGRLGSVVGANIVGALITNNCESAFIAAGVSLIINGCLGFFIVKPGKLNKFSVRRASLLSMTGN